MELKELGNIVFKAAATEAHKRLSNGKDIKELKLVKAIKDLEIPLLTEANAIEIANILPKNLNELRTIFAGSKITVAPENLDKLFEVIKSNEK